MSQKYHIKPDGTVGICNAEKERCPYQSAPHFDSEQEAQNYVNKQSEKEFGLLGIHKQQSDNTHTDNIKDFDVKWTGKYPSLCNGQWIIKCDNQRLELPEDRESKPMGTLGRYQRWYFKGWEDTWEQYIDGQDKDEWITANLYWLIPSFQQCSIPTIKENYENLFYQIQKRDFRSGSCGGCI